jgi:hypothetical protein
MAAVEVYDAVGFALLSGHTVHVGCTASAVINHITCSKSGHGKICSTAHHVRCLHCADSVLCTCIVTLAAGGTATVISIAVAP